VVAFAFAARRVVSQLAFVDGWQLEQAGDELAAMGGFTRHGPTVIADFS
jgi:hypothetical protein